MIQPEQVRRVALLGAGTIGASWAAWFLSRGMHVAVYDPDPAAEGYVRRFVADAWPTLRRLGMSAEAAAEAATFHSDPAAAVARADFVQENAPERLNIKRDLYAAVDQALGDDTIVASSSSGIIMSALQAGFRAAPRMAIGHPFNPPHLIPLVEVVAGRETAPGTVAWCLEFYRHVGKRPIHLRKEAPGHLANRLQAALYREAVSALESGLASVEDIDTAIAAGPGLRWAIMGPHLTFHLGGGEGGMTHMLAQFRPVFEEWWASMRTPELTDALCRHIVEGVAEEARGRTVRELAAERDELLVEIMAVIERRRRKG